MPIKFDASNPLHRFCVGGFINGVIASYAFAYAPSIINGNRPALGWIFALVPSISMPYFAFKSAVHAQKAFSASGVLMKNGFDVSPMSFYAVKAENLDRVNDFVAIAKSEGFDKDQVVYLLKNTNDY